MQQIVQEVASYSTVLTIQPTSNGTLTLTWILLLHHTHLGLFHQKTLVMNSSKYNLTS